MLTKAVTYYHKLVYEGSGRLLINVFEKVSGGFEQSNRTASHYASH